jgi:hypothetical protein
MLATGRRSSHISSWRGPCVVTDRLSTTSYRVTEENSGRVFERVVSNVLPYRATSIRSSAAFQPYYSDPFAISEIIAVRDIPDSVFYVTKVTHVSDVDISVHYFGCTRMDLTRAIFRPFGIVRNRMR